VSGAAPAPRFTPPPALKPGEPLKIAVLVSGKGTTLQNFVDEIHAGRLRAEIKLVISSKLKAFALARAVRAGLKASVIRRREFDGPVEYGRAIAAAAQEAGAELICMAGFLEHWKIPESLMGRVLNIHPSLLPAFGGKGLHGDIVHESVLARGCKVSGCTVHVADDEYDAGPIVLQRTVPVRDDDTPEMLKARVFHEECLAYPQALRLFAEGRIEFVGRRVRVVPPRSA